MFEQMKTFVRIAETGSITRAARSLGLSLPMASRHLRRLETELDTALVHRTTRQLHLTAAGQEFATRARGLLAALEDAKRAVQPSPSLVGRVVVTAPSGLGTYRLSPIVMSLAAKHPRLRVELRLEDGPVDLVKEGVDLAIRTARLPDRASLVGRELATYERVVCTAPAFLARYGDIDSLEALAAAPCLLYAGCPRAAVWDFETPEGPKSISVDGPLYTNNVVTIREAIFSGVGVAWLPDYLVREALSDGRLVRLLPQAKLPPIRIYGIMSKQARETATIRAVLDTVAAALRVQAGPRRVARHG